MQYIFTLDGEVPSKKNNRVVNRRTGRNYPSKEYRKWYKAVALQLLEQECPAKPIEQCSNVIMRFYHTDKRRRDTNNQMASVFDLLVDCHILVDDNWCVTGAEIGCGYMCTDGQGARCTVLIETD